MALSLTQSTIGAMMNWGLIEIPGPAEDKIAIKSVMHEFGILHINAGGTPGAALFRGASATSGSYQIYLTPEAMELTGGKLGGYVATACAQVPTLGPLLSGDQSAAKMFKGNP